MESVNNHPNVGRRSIGSEDLKVASACAFTTCDDSYVANAVVSLHTVKRWNPGIDLVVIGRTFSEQSKRLCERYNICLLEVDLSEAFSISWRYPVECFYWFAAPKVLLERGYEKALYIDADVYCHGSILEELSHTATIAGVSGGSVRGILKSDLPTIERHHGVIPDLSRLQTGVLLLDLPFLVQWGLLEKASNVFEEAIKHGFARKGDDSLLALVMCIYPDLNPMYLGREFNLMQSQRHRHGSAIWLDEAAEDINSIKFFHFTKAAPKPWDMSFWRQPSYTSQFFFKKWVLSAIELFSEHDLNRHFKRISKKLSRRHLRFYWWPSTNVGDLVTKYLIEKYPKDLGDVRPISEREIRRIEQLSLLTAPLYSLLRMQPPAKYIVSTGSVVRLCGRRALVFGSGIRSKRQAAKAAHVRFVRGPQTRESFRAAGAGCPPIFGDPGLLMPRFYSPPLEKRYRLAIIPHFTEFADIYRRYENDKDVFVVDMGNGNLEGCIDAIAASEVTVSSSLHGVIFSHAYGIPTRHVMFSDKVFGDGTKFADYYESIRLPLRTLDLRNSELISKEFLMHAADEVLLDFDDSRLSDEFFIDQNGIKRSALFPF